MAPTATKKGWRGSEEELREVRVRELELRRLSGEVACANCRRLKLKCDKKIPCSSCAKRRTESSCPLGSGGNCKRSPRSALSCHSCHYSQRWKQKAALLSNRVQALEDALALESEARGGTGSHPLLTEELLAMKHSLFIDESVDDDEEEEENSDELPDAFGTLSIGESRTMRYLGPAASESALLMEVLENSAPRLPITGDSPKSGQFSREIIHSSRSFPFAPLFLDENEEIILAQLVCYLPQFERATALYEAFFMNVSWYLAPVERSHFVSEIIALFYPHRKRVLPGNVLAEHAHDLALLLALFACGAAGDLTQSPVNDEAAQYYILAKAALGVKSIMHGASLSGVQTLYLLAAYDVYTGEKKSQEDGWKLVTLASCMAAAIGLHRDPARWGLDVKMIERRRRVFWETYLIDTWRSLESGRPSTFRPCVIDCELPSDAAATIGEGGEIVESVIQWRYRYLRDVVSEVCERLVSARPLKYRDVLELDRKIRDFPPHPFAVNSRPQEDHLGIDADFRRIFPIITIWDREETLMYIHRNFFAKAILDFPDNPMRSPFAVSFLATYRSASNIIRLAREHIDNLYLTVLRIWHVWSLCLTCGVIAGVVASLGTSVSFATSAFVELEYIITLFEKYNDHKVAKHGLHLLRRIREKAIAALRQPGKRHTTTTTDNTAVQRTVLPTIRKETDDVDDELLILRGITRIVEQRHDPSLPPDRNALLGTGTPEWPSYNHSQARGSQTDHTQQYTDPIDGMREAQSLPHGNNPRSTVGFHVSQAEPDAWLKELEEILGPSPTLQGPASSGFPNGQQASSGGRTLDLSGNVYPPQSMAVPNVPYVSTDAPMPSYVGTSDTTGPTPDVLLNETVSTEEWRQLLQQSGFCNTPPFDFDLGSFITPTSSATPDWHSNLS